MRRAALLALLILAIAVAPAAAQKWDGVIKIGFTVSLTGRFQVEGHYQLNGIKLWAKWVNEHGGIVVNGKHYKVELVYYDDQSSKDLVRQLYEKLITQDKVNFLFSPYSSGLSAAAVPIAEKYGVPIIVVGAASDSIFTKLHPHCAFQIYTPASHYLWSSLELVKKYLGDKAKVYILYEDSVFAATAAQGALEYAKEHGIKVVGVAKYPPGTKDFLAMLEKVRASGANVLIGGGHYEDGVMLARQIRESGLDKQLEFVSLLVAVDAPKFYQDLGPLANGFAGPSQWEPMVRYSPEAAKKLGIEWIGPTVQEFVKMYRSTYHSMPDYHAAGGFAAGLFLQAAIEKAGSIDRRAVCMAAKKLDIMTFFGRLRVDPNTGLQVAHKMVLVQWQNGRKVIIWPPEAATAKPWIPAFAPARATATPVKTAKPTMATMVPATVTKTTYKTVTVTKTRTVSGGGAGALVAAAIIAFIIGIVVGYAAGRKRK